MGAGGTETVQWTLGVTILTSLLIPDRLSQFVGMLWLGHVARLVWSLFLMIEICSVSLNQSSCIVGDPVLCGTFCILYDKNPDLHCIEVSVSVYVCFHVYVWTHWATGHQENPCSGPAKTVMMYIFSSRTIYMTCKPYHNQSFYSMSEIHKNGEFDLIRPRETVDTQTHTQ